MKGLIINDFLSLRKLLKSVAAIIMIFGILWGASGNASVAVVTVGTLSVTYLLNLFSYDEFYHWNSYAGILPVSKKQLVLARYATFGISSLATLVLAVIYLAVLGSLDGDGWGSIIGMLLMQVYTAVVLIPICYKFGIQKGRMIYILLMVVPFLLVLAMVDLMENKNIVISREIYPLIGLGAVVLTVAAIMISIKISVSVVSKKEY